MAWRQDRFAEDEVQEGSQNRQEEEKGKVFVHLWGQVFKPQISDGTCGVSAGETYSCKISHLMSVSSRCLWTLD